MTDTQDTTAPWRRIIIHLLELTGGTCVLLCLLLAIQTGWMLWGVGIDTTVRSRQEEQATSTTIHGTETDKVATLRTDDPPVAEAPGTGETIGWIRIPTLGRDWRLPIAQGIGQDILDRMVAGHYDGTAMAGDRGNAAYAAHDVPFAFGAIYDLPAGTQVIIETGDTWYVYETNPNPTIVDKSQTSVIDPGAAGAGRGLTMTTCWPMGTPVDTGQRFIMHAHLTGWAPKSDGMPASLAQSRPTTTQRAGRVIATISEQVSMPATGVLAACAALAWLVADGLLWALTWRRTLATWARPTWNPATCLWRLQAGQTAGPRWVAWIPRLLPTLLLLAAATMAMWRWGSPWLAENIPFLATPHPAMG